MTKKIIGWTAYVGGMAIVIFGAILVSVGDVLFRADNGLRLYLAFKAWHKQTFN